MVMSDNKCFCLIIGCPKKGFCRVVVLKVNNEFKLNSWYPEAANSALSASCVCRSVTLLAFEL